MKCRDFSAIRYPFFTESADPALTLSNQQTSKNLERNLLKNFWDFEGNRFERWKRIFSITHVGLQGAQKCVAGLVVAQTKEERYSNFAEIVCHRLNKKKQHSGFQNI